MLARLIPAVCVSFSMLALALPIRADGLGTLAVGERAADFGLRRIEPETGELGRMHWLSDYVGPEARTPRKLLLLSFYATWCKACVQEMPALSHLQSQLGPQGLQVLGLNVRAAGEDATQAQVMSHRLIRELGLQFPLLLDRYTSRNTSLFVGEPAVLPCHIVVDADGKIMARLQGQAVDHIVELTDLLQRHLSPTVAAPLPSPIESPSSP